MAYSITRTNGTVLGSIADGTFNDTATSLTLVGRNYSNYGQIMTDTLVSLLENFSYNISPSNPLSGQLWWDTGNGLLKVYTGAEWKIVSSCTAQASAPTTTTAGDLWWDSDDQQLYVYNGTSPYNAVGWIEVGPGYPVSHKTGAILEVIYDAGAAAHYVISMYADGSRTAIISKDSEFVPNVAISGLTTVQPGINMLTGFTLWGTANNSSYLGGQPAANYFRTNQNNFGSGNLAIGSDAGITIGAGSDLTLQVNGIHAQILNNTSGGNVEFWSNATGTLTQYLTITSSGNIEVSKNPQTDLGVATKQYVDDSFINANLWGVSTAVTAPEGTSNLMIATTEFVASGLSGIYKYKIYQGDSHMWFDDSGSGGANLVVDSRTVMTATIAGVDLKNGATAVTQTQNYTSAGNSRVATTSYVHTAQQWWGNATHKSYKWVSTSAPSAGVNDVGSNNGDFWFQISS